MYVSDVSMFSSYQVARTSSVLMGKRLTCFCSWCWYGGSEVYFGKDHPAEECAARSLH